MPTDPPPQGPRRHLHRGRRGFDRRHQERRGPQQSPQGEPAPHGEHVDVEQIMRDIRARIASRHGIELTDQQVQELAARRLESILDPRTIKPSLLDELRRSAGIRPEAATPADRAGTSYAFDDATLYESRNALMRVIRRLLKPFLRLFFNPDSVARALQAQARLNAEFLQREAERDRRQTEWNALHYEILHKLVTEITKVSLEVQSLSLRVESLAGKVDFNERRVRDIEGTLHQARPSGREPAPVGAASPGAAAIESMPVVAARAATEMPAGEAPRRRRRRRRGRRGGGAEAAAAGAGAGASSTAGAVEPETETEEIEEAGERGAFDVASPGVEEAQAPDTQMEPHEPQPSPEPPLDTPIALHEPEHASPTEAPASPDESRPDRDPFEP